MIPISIELTNFQTYTKAKLDFKFSSALIVGERDNNTEVSNGAGKSAIFEAITWVLFGKSRQKNSDSIIKRGAEGCEVDFLFEHDGQKYRIIRKRNARFSKVEVSLFKVNADGTESFVQSDTNTEAAQRIKDLLKVNHDTFLNCSYFVQGSISDFLVGTPLEKHKIIGSILNLAKWDKYQDAAKKNLADKNKEIEKLNFKLKGSETVEQDLITVAQELLKNKEEAERLLERESVLNEEILSLEQEIAGLKSAEALLEEYNDLSGQLDNTKDRIVEVERQILNQQNEIASFVRKIEANDSTKADLEKKIQELSTNIELGKNSNCEALEAEYLEKRTFLRVLEDEIKEWNGDDICPCCKNPWSQHTKELEEHNNRIKEKDQLRKDLSILSTQINACKEIQNKVKRSEIEIEKYTVRINSLENTNEILSLKKSSSEKELSSLNSSLSELIVKRNKINSKISAIAINDHSTIDDKRRSLKSKRKEKDELSQQRSDLSFLVGGLVQKEKELSAKKIEKDKLAISLSEEKKQSAIYSSLVRSFGRTGIQAIIVDNVIEELTKEANKWLNEFCYEPTYIKFITQKKDSKGGWKETLELSVITPSGECDIESLSGGEAFRLGFAIRLALSQIQARRVGGETQMLMLDEVSSSLDKHGLQTFVSIIKKLEKHMKIMVITHDDNLKDEFGTVILAKRQGDNSSLEVI